MKKVRFRPGELNYRRNTTIGSPFLKRGQVSFPYDGVTKAKRLQVRRMYYELFFANEKEAYLCRNQTTFQTDSTDQSPSFLLQEDLPGNPLQIRFSLSRLIDQVLASLQSNPHTLFSEAARIRSVCAEVGVDIPVVDAFYRVGSWNEFIELLSAIADKQSRFQFELLIAAITQYAERCSS
jgi:hypothetical protein